MPIFWRNIQVVLLNKIHPGTLLVGRLAQNYGIKTVGLGWASGPVGDVATFPAHVRPDYAALNWINALTADLKRELTEWGYPPDRISIIPNGVDTDMFAPPAAPPPGLHVAYTGQFRPEKRIDVILQAWKLLQPDFPAARLSLIGGSDRMAEYQRMAADLGIQPDFVGLLPPPQVRDRLQTAHIFIMSGMSEGMSNALLEGMAVGLAPIVTDTPGNRALITPGENGLVYDGTSPEALAAGLRRLLTDSELRARLGAAARQTVVQQYSLQSVVDRYLALFERVIAEK
jgi:glycosyltransferase involved in cell wall biosynthesis